MARPAGSALGHLNSGFAVAELCADTDREGISIIAEGRISSWRDAPAWAPPHRHRSEGQAQKAAQAAQAGEGASTT